jgi:hypothetical protein
MHGCTAQATGRVSDDEPLETKSDRVWKNLQLWQIGFHQTCPVRNVVPATSCPPTIWKKEIDLEQLAQII